MVDTMALGAIALRRGGSSPSRRTKIFQKDMQLWRVR